MIAVNRARYFLPTLIKKCWMPFAILLITTAILFSLFRALTPWAKQYKGEVEQHLSTLLGQPVVISSMETSWYWFEPVLRLNQVTVSDRQDQVLTLSKLMIGIDLLNSVLHWRIEPGILYVDDVHLTLRQRHNHWEVDGLRHGEQMPKLTSESYLPILNWLLGQQKIIIKNLSALVHLNDGSLLPVAGLNLTVVNHGGHYRLKGMAKLAQTTSTELLILADMKLNPRALHKGSGHAYFSVHRFLPTQWKDFFPTLPYHVEGGKGDFEIWLDVLKGQVSALQTQFNFHRISWSKEGSSHSQFIQFIGANLAWKQSQDGWQLSGDRINLRSEGTRWPQNSFVVNYEKAPQTYRVFVKNLLLGPILKKDIDWPEMMYPILALHPIGELHDTQIGFKLGQVDYLLTRFNHLSWQAQDNVPTVSNLSGAVHWQPSAGRLELDGENTILAPRNLSPIIFSQVNAAFEWKELSHGLRVSMERLILSHPDFIFSARGALDEPFLPDLRHLQLTGEFSAENAAKWLAYIPSQYLKPKLDDWLKHAIKRIDKVSGQLTLNGALSDFPFDKMPGEFSIVTRFTGMDLFFNKKWPLMRDVDTYIRLDKRTLDFDVLHGDLNGITLEQANLRINDVGLDKETLLAHGQVEAPGNKIRDYILASPLKTRLKKLKSLDFKELLALDLNLEIPLYPENDDVLARGAITFNDNEIIFHHALNDLVLNHLTGILQFDEQGISTSELKGRLLGDSVDIHLQSVKEPKPATVVNIEGNTTIDLLREKFDLPLFSFLDGHVNIRSELTLTNDKKDMDHMQITTPLEGVAIDLPVPFGKKFEQTAPLTIDIDFNSEKALNMRFNYDNRLKSELWFSASEDTFILKIGQIQIGNGAVVWKKIPGIQIGGALPDVDVTKWQKVIQKFPTDLSSPKLLDSLQSVDVKVGDIAIWDQNYKNVAIKANKISSNAWSFQLEQRDIAGNLRYQRTTNTLSGGFQRFYLPKSILNKKPNNSVSTLKPSDIPNLNLTVDVFKLGDVAMGNVAIKSTSNNTQWHLENGTIKSPAYQLTMQGEWKQIEGKNTTNLQANLQISKLADTLESWHITPAVETHQGSVDFSGGWQGSINEFALAKTSGQMNIVLRNGRITHLSPETEEKLGLGKMLSILSLQTIPRRLKLDFSDLAHGGYSFDTFKGSFALNKGVLTTTDSYIDGPVAYASMKGDLDLSRQLYDVNLHISPHITASLPIVATIAGGPIAGIATWVASKIINQGMQTVTGYTYKVSGPWSNPVVQQVSIFKKKS